jgi:pimeloyl-ACP methyl ester carboxylesterase
MADDPATSGGAPVELGGPDPDDARFVYEELSLLHENCLEHDLPWDGTAEVERVRHDTSSGDSLSALRWGSGEVQVVLLHGSAQNAHTWDTVALALRPAAVLAVDLPGHGRSSWREDAAYDPHTNAEAVIEMMDGVVGSPVLLVGMSLGGLTATRVAALRPDLVEALAVVDVTPGVTRDKAKEIHEFIAGPQSFDSFREIFERTVVFNPTRSASSLRRGILHNAHRSSEGTWEWNYDRRLPTSGRFPSPEELWGDVETTTMPYLLVRGADSPIVDDDDAAELLRRRPDAQVVVVEEAGHSVQGDQPLVLADLLHRHRTR